MLQCLECDFLYNTYNCMETDWGRTTNGCDGQMSMLQYSSLKMMQWLTSHAWEDACCYMY